MKHADILEAARTRLAEAETADRENRERAAHDLRFVTGDQWDSDIRAERELEGKPCMTFNGMAQFVRQVTGQIRSLNPSVTVIPGDAEASEDVADIIGGLVRHIESACDAESVYEAAAESAAACGIGHFRLRTEYEDGDTFDQRIKIERVHNPFSVFWDPQARQPDRSDAKFCFVAQEMRSSDFEKAYPKVAASDITSDSRPHGFEMWYRGDTVTVAEYFWVEEEEYEIGLLSNGQVVRDPRVPMDIVRKRKVKEPRVKWAKVTGQDVLEGPMDFPSRYIPVVSVTGEEWHLGDQMYRSSVIRFAKDAQQLYNYSQSTLAEVVALQPRAPYLVTARQIAGFETFWNEANRANRPYLPYHSDPAAGAPQRQSPPVSSQGLSQQIALASEDMKRTTGIYDASLGAKSNETSGVAIQQRQAESQNATSIYADNLVKAVWHAGRILVDMIPRVYDTQRIIRILGEDDAEKMEQINVVRTSIDGTQVINDLTAGRYDVRIRVGPSFETKREAAADGMLKFIQAVPQAAAVTADLIAKVQDWPESERFAERLRKILPPGILDIEDMPEEQAQQMMAQQQQQQQMAQMMAEIEQMRVHAGVKKEVAEADEAEADAQKAALEVADAQIDLAAKSGQLSAVIEQTVMHVLQQVAAQQMGARQGF